MSDRDDASLHMEENGSAVGYDNPALSDYVSHGSSQKDITELDEIKPETAAIGIDDAAVRAQRQTMHFEQDGSNLRIDYILAFKLNENQPEHAEMRQVYEENLKNSNLILQLEDIRNSCDNETYYVKVHATWDALISGAELLNLKKRIQMPKDETSGFSCGSFCHPFEAGQAIVPEEDDYFTAHFTVAKIQMFAIDWEDPQSFFTNSERSLIVKEILDRAAFTRPDVGGDDGVRFGIHKLLRLQAYTHAYPLHEGRYLPEDYDTDPFGEGMDKDRKRLYEAWARAGRWYCYQPLDLIRKYFGEKIGIYFAWLGFYTWMLILPSMLGVAAFLYGVLTLYDNVPSNDICDKEGIGNQLMCPQCDKRCTYWHLSESCIYARITYLFDNYATVAFAAFMAVWATFFLEFWKRKQKELEYDWDVADYELEERMRPEFEFKVKKRKANPITLEPEPYLTLYSRCCRTMSAYTVVLFMISLVLAAIFGIVIYRIIVAALIYATSIETVAQYAKIITSLTAALINLVIILILNLVYRRVAYFLTEMEYHRTETEFEDSFTFKMFLFQFVNFYGSTFYIAFFKGRFITYPGDSKTYLFGKWKQDECDPAGCLVDLFIHLVMVMVGKQIINNAKELFIPLILSYFRKKTSKKQETAENLYLRWEQDKDLAELPTPALFEEYLEMVIQYGFVTIFVAAFPLAPLFAFLNNVIEIRLDAYKFVCLWRRPVAMKAQDIGIWLHILTGLSFIAVLSNAFIMAWTSQFVPMLYYLMVKSSDNTMNGYIRHSLSNFSVIDFPDMSIPNEIPEEFGTVTTCMYPDYRNPGPISSSPDAYAFTKEFWHILVARLAFIIVFEHFCFFVTYLLSAIIPDVPTSVKRQMLHERQLVKKLNFDASVQGLRERAKRNSQADFQ